MAAKLTTLTNRRRFLESAPAAALAAGTPAAGKRLTGLRLGVIDTVLRMPVKPEVLAMARGLGFEGVQLSIGRPVGDGGLPLSDPALQARYLAEAKKQRIRLSSTYLDILHVNCLKNDKLAPQWVLDGIRITRKLDLRILMIVFFNKCALATPPEMDAVAGALRELAPEARKAGVVLGFENTISAEDNLRILDRVASDALKVFYDIGNSTNVGGFDVPAEIRRLGRDRICQFHFKDKGYLGEGKVDVRAALLAIADIGFRGFAVLETSAPSGSVEKDLKRNLEYTRRLMSEL